MSKFLWVFESPMDLIHYAVLFSFVALLGQDYSFFEIPLPMPVYWGLGFIFFICIDKALHAWWGN